MSEEHNKLYLQEVWREIKEFNRHRQDGPSDG